MAPEVRMDYFDQAIKKDVIALAGVAQSCTLKCHGLDSQSGRMPTLRVLSPVGAHTRDN